MFTRLLATFALLLAFTACTKQTGAASAHEVADFATDVIAASQSTPVVVDFWAPWCGPCRMLTPTIEKAAAQAEGRWKLVAVNVDNHPDLSAKYGIQSIPNVKLFHRGTVVAEFVGVVSEVELRAWLETNLPK